VTTYEIWPGKATPLGATFDGAGTNFALYSEVAEKVELCLVDREGLEQILVLPERSGHVFHGYVQAALPGQRYGYRVYGPWDPARGHRCDPTKLLLDPYAKAIERGRWSLVTSPWFDWSGDHPPNVPWHRTVIYEVHVRGFTQRHPEIPAELRGTYAGLAHPAAIEHLKSLGVTAVELLPVHEFVHERFLRRKGLRNYWGYASVGYFAPHGEYAARGSDGHQVSEFKDMVRSLHAAGIEVILDVVYNHTGEGTPDEPPISFRGIDNAAYYRIDPKDPTKYVDFTGTGNSLNMRNPHVIQLIMDSLRYWVTEMHVDGFRFDLAPVLARELHSVNRLSTFFQIIQQDPVLQNVKLIAEPWDLGEGGYQIGNFPSQWSEWNGKYRDTVRDFWRGRDQTLAELAHRLTGSSDLYGPVNGHGGERRPNASINFVTCHDGFTLADLVAYDRKHNDANLEDNRDGTDDNRSWNHGVEGPTMDPQVRALRLRQQRNFLATLMLSQGVPMLSHGDELARSQRGNNNGYCQDNELTWIDWEHADESLLAFTRKLIRLRTEHPVFQRRNWFQGRSIRGTALSDIGWFRPDGQEMTESDWKVAYARSLGVFLNGEGIGSVDERGRPILDDSFYLILNGHHATLDFVLPEVGAGLWTVSLDTAEPSTVGSEFACGETVEVLGRSVQLLRRRRGDLRRVSRLPSAPPPVAPEVRITTASPLPPPPTMPMFEARPSLPPEYRVPGAPSPDVRKPETGKSEGKPESGKPDMGKSEVGKSDVPGKPDPSKT